MTFYIQRRTEGVVGGETSTGGTSEGDGTWKGGEKMHVK